MDMNVPTDAEMQAIQNEARRMRAEALRGAGSAIATWVSRLFKAAPEAAASTLARRESRRPA